MEKDKKGKYIRRERYCGPCKEGFYVGDSIKEEISRRIQKWHLKINVPKEILKK
jgi:hypothetical protein